MRVVNFWLQTSLACTFPFILLVQPPFKSGSVGGAVVKNPPATWETWVQSLGWEDPWKRERLLTPVFWPGEFHKLYSPWGHKELDMTERLSLH